MTAQLISAADGYHLWSERYDRELIDVFAVQDEIAQSIAGALQSEARVEPRQAHARLPAYEALLKARHYAANVCRRPTPAPRTTASRRSRSTRCMQRPMRCWVSSSLATRTRAGPCWRSRPTFATKPAAPWKLDPFETDPHFLLGAVAAAVDYDSLGAAREFQSAMASPSASAGPVGPMRAFSRRGRRLHEGTAEMRRAVEKDPLSVNWRGF